MSQRQICKSGDFIFGNARIVTAGECRVVTGRGRSDLG